MTDSPDNLNRRFKESAENFSLNPSPGTWKMVEKDISNRKRNRRFINFFFAGILISGSILFINYITSESEQNSAGNNKTVTKVQPATQKEKINDKNDSVAGIDSENELNEINNELTYENKNSAAKINSITTVKHSANEYTVDEGSIIIDVTNPTDAINVGETTTIITKSAIEKVSDSAITVKTEQEEIIKDSLTVQGNDTLKDEVLISTADTSKLILPGKWSLALSIAPAKSFSSFHEDGDYNFVANYRDSTDENLITWNYHLNINYALLPELELYTGIGMLNFEQEILSKQVVYAYDSSGGTGPITSVAITKGYFHINGDTTGTIKNKFTYIEIPLGIKYNFMPYQKFRISLDAEVAFNKLINSKGYDYNFSSREYEIINENYLRSWIIAYGAGLSFQHPINKNIDLELTPFYRSLQKSVYKSTYALTQKFQQAELRLSVRYIFK